MKDFIEKLKYVQLKDVVAIFLFIIAYPLSYIVKYYEGSYWLVCEEKFEARDNGYWFFRYVCENQPKQKIIYAISKKSPDYYKVKSLGKVISYGTLIHWIYYLAADVNISSQKGGKPNPAVCYFLEVYGILKNKRVFLQHGVTINDLPWLYYDNTKMNLFICSVKPEYEFVRGTFGYPKGHVVYTGLARQDNLCDTSEGKKRILVMPTWRDWLSGQKVHDNTIDIAETEYARRWNEFLNSDKLDQIARKYNLEILFFPHRNMQQYLSTFYSKSSHVKIVNWKDWDIQEALKSSNLMITDYSSVFFDFVYMKKPVIFYQFDEEEFRKKQYGKGYFDYHNNPFGVSRKSLNDVLAIMEMYVESNFKVDDTYLKGHKDYFPLYDRNNSMRIYKAILSMIK